jgi:hypothetical protein
MIARELHQIEISSRCQLRCVYCLHPTLTRPKQDIDRETWLSALDWVRYFVRRGTQGELVLFGTGEPFLHPDLVRLVAEARAIVGPMRRLLATTNGLLVTEGLVAALRPFNLRVYVSLHQPVQATAAVHRLHRAGLLEGVSVDAVTGSNSWAGQVDWPNVMPIDATRPPCPWQQAGWLFVSADGALYGCCYANGDAPQVGHVAEAPHDVEVGPLPICPACWQRAPFPHERHAVRLNR